MIAVTAIALGIGANTALFSVINSVILEPLPFAEPERLVMVWETRPDRSIFRNVVSNANYLDWKARNRVFDAMSPVFFQTNTVIGAGDAEDVRVQMVGEDFFPMLGARMQIGRSFTAAECRPDGPVLVVLADAYWRTRFSADPGIVGRSLRLGRDAATVIGVAPPGLMSLEDRAPALWRNARIRGATPEGRRSAGRNMAVLARLKPGVSVSDADREMVGLAKALESEFPEFNANWSARVVSLREQLTGKARTPLFILLAAVGCVLLIACANVANLLLVQTSGRIRELAVRVSLGATRGRLMRQLLIESLTLAGAGAAAGLVLGLAVLAVLKKIGPPELRRLEQASLDPAVLLFTLGLTLLTGLVLGLAPALTVTNTAVNPLMRESGRGTTASGRSNRLRDILMVAQVALSLMLLAGAGLLLKSFVRLTSVDTGFRAENVFTATVSLPGNRYADGRGAPFIQELRRRVKALPGVIEASNVTFLPFKGQGSGTYYWRADQPKPEPGQEPGTDVRMTQPGYFETMGIPLLQGRLFQDSDMDSKAPLRFVINESLARALYPREDAVGKHLVVLMQEKNPPGEIIGVTRDVKHAGLDAAPRPTVYYPQSHLFFNFGTVVARVDGAPMMLAAPFTRLVQEMDPEIAVSDVAPMQRWIDDSIARPRFQLRLLATLAGLAFVLAVIGIYGVVSYGVAQRRNEIGIRMALGAQQGHVLRMVLSRGLRLCLIGLAIGTGGSLALGRYLKTLLFEVQPSDPATLAGVAGLFLLVALAATYIPARGAARADPLQSLRYE